MGMRSFLASAELALLLVGAVLGIKSLFWSLARQVVLESQRKFDSRVRCRIGTDKPATR